MSALHAEDPLKYLIDLEYGCSDPEMKDNIQTLRLLISILRPLLRFLLEWPLQRQQIQELSKHTFSVVQKVSWSFEPRPLPHLKPAEDAVASNLKTVKSLKEDMAGIVTIRRTSFPQVMYSWSCGSEHLIRFLDSLLQNLKDISITCKAQRIVGQREELAVVEERLKYVKTLLCLILVPSKWMNVVDSVVNLAVEISYKLFLCFVDDELAAGDLIGKFNSLLPELKEVCCGSDSLRLQHKKLTINGQVLGFVDFLISKLMLLSTKDGFMDELKVQFQILAGELRFIRFGLMDMLLQNSIQEIESLHLSIVAFILDAGFVIYFSPDKVLDGESAMTNYWSRGLHDSLEAVQTVHQQATDLFKKHLRLSLQSNCPSGKELDFIDFFVGTVRGIAFVYPLKHQIVMLDEEMVTLRKCLSGVAELMGSSRIESFLTRASHAVFQAKYVLQLLMDGKGSLWLHRLGIFVITNDIRILQKEVKTILNMNLESGVHSISMASIHASTQIHQPPSTNAPTSSNDGMQIKIERDASKLVGRKDAVAEIVGRLTEGSSQLTILSIVGMAGVGKTTLTNAVYKHPSVDTYFEVRAWGNLSQVYRKETLLSSILGQICQVHTTQSHDIAEEDVGQMLYQSLKRRKYLIVLDNIWDIKAWGDLRSIFPDDENGSRILCTTQSQAIATQANSFPYNLCPLSNEESCELLWLKLFKGATNCPQELSSISKRIAYSCKGLPLAVVLIAGTLKRTKKVKHSWEKVAKNFIRSRSLQKQIWDILEVSYKLLPGHLKSCFWYFGTFPEGTTISVSKLIRLWISEGFVQLPNTGQKSLVQEAKDYLNDLIDRSLVLVTRKSSKGGVKECRVHDVLQEFCSAVLKQERYEKRENISGGISVLHGDFKLQKWNILKIFSAPKELQIYSFIYYSTSVTEKDSGGGEYLPEQEQLRDVPTKIGGDAHSEQAIFSHLVPIDKGHLSEQVPNQCRQLNFGSVPKYKYLRVLDLANVLFQNSANTFDLVSIAKLVYLRYLAVRIRTTEIPSEIGNLRNLETFHLSGAIGRIMLPEAIWKLACLRDVIMDHCFFSFQHYNREFFEDSSQLDNLKSLSTIYIWHGNVEKLMRMLPGVQKLGCIFSDTWQECCEASNLFKILECLRELQSLKMSFHVRAPNPFKFTFPSNLKKLTISNARLPWDEISVISQLPKLEVLKLLNKAFEGQQWDMREGEFQKLKFLKLDSLDFVYWSASSEHLPYLEQLVVLSCQQLEEIPSCFGEISTLQLIELKWCSTSATDSVKQIIDDQDNYGNHQLNVTVVGSEHGFL